MIWASRRAQCVLQLHRCCKGHQARMYVCSQISRKIIGIAFLPLKEQTCVLTFLGALQLLHGHKDLHASYNYGFGLWDVYPLTSFALF